jgi:beta-phosphoglucomutase-like phosphatase (HAD superfamily)
MLPSAPDWQAELNIAALGISKNMQFIQMLEDGIKPKPCPDLYQLAYEKMAKLFTDLKKSEILVIEDSISGVTAARVAGLEVIHCRMAMQSLPIEVRSWMKSARNSIKRKRASKKPGRLGSQHKWQACLNLIMFTEQ